jgi:hypothetical protein
LYRNAGLARVTPVLPYDMSLWTRWEGHMRWMTYGEIAEQRGIDRASAVVLVRRNKWQRRPMGDGTARIQVLVPADKLTVPRHVNPLRDEIATLRLQVARLTQRLEGR